MSNIRKAPKCPHFSVGLRQERALHSHRREARRSLVHLLHYYTLENKSWRGQRKSFSEVLFNISSGINSMSRSSCDYSGLRSKLRVHLWLLEPAQRGCWNPSNINSKSGSPNKHALAVACSGIRKLSDTAAYRAERHPAGHHQPKSISALPHARTSLPEDERMPWTVNLPYI